MGISADKMKYWKKNIIELKGIKVHTTKDNVSICHYEDYTIGENIVSKLKLEKNVDDRVIPINISQVKGSFIAIVIEYNDSVKKVFPHVEILKDSVNSADSEKKQYILIALISEDKNIVGK